MTSGCTKQAFSYHDHREDLTSANSIVVGISSDKIEAVGAEKDSEEVLNFLSMQK
jgi:peroxiredoxin